MELYLVLEVIWWLLLGVLLMGLGVMVGMDMGVGTILRYVGRTDAERRVALNIIGPHWDGNQVWFILGGGAIFAAWPLVYATAFSGFYIVMLVLLWSMIVRPLGFEYRSKLPTPAWRNAWDWSLLVSGLVPMVIYGAAVGNVLRGVPFYFDWRMTSYYTGSFLELLNPFAVLCGLVSLALSIYMGGAILQTRSDGEMAARARKAAILGGIVAVVLFTLCGIWVANMDGFRIVSSPPPGIAQIPLHQTVEVVPGGLMDNFRNHPILWLVPALGYVGMIVGMMALKAGRGLLGWWMGALAWIGVLGTAGATMFPFIMPSSLNPSHSLTVWNSGASALTMSWMLGFTIIFMPIIIGYTSWAFWLMRGKITTDHVDSSEHAL